MINYDITEPYDRTLNKSFPPIPNGIYHVEIVKAEYVKGDYGSKILKIRFSIDDYHPDYYGRLIFLDLYIEYINPSKTEDQIRKKMKIDKNNLTGILEVLRKTHLDNVFELIGAKLQIEIKSSPNKNNPDKPYTNVIDFLDYLYMEGAHNKAKEEEQTVNPGAIDNDVPF